MELELGEPGLSDEAYKDAAAAVGRHLEDSRTDVGAAAAWLTAGDRLIQQWGLAASASRSSVLPIGFVSRIANAARALIAWKAQPGNDALAAEAENAISVVEAHIGFRDEQRRVHRLRMAQRLIRRGFELTVATTTADAFIAYTADGAWLDRRTHRRAAERYRARRSGPVRRPDR